MGNYRNRFDIIANILKIASEGAKKTQIMYQCNLSYKLLTKYLIEVTESCLIRYESRKRRYTITSKGREFLEGYKDYSKHNKHVERQLSDVQNKRKALEELCSNK